MRGRMLDLDAHSWPQKPKREDASLLRTMERMRAHGRDTTPLDVWTASHRFFESNLVTNADWLSYFDHSNARFVP